MPKKRWTVIVDWSDGDVADADEVVVYAESAAQAISIAKQKWRMTVGAVWPDCRFERVWILPPRRRLGVV
jgi:hypothetical protein